MASGHGLRLRAGPVSADDACRARAAAWGFVFACHEANRAASAAERRVRRGLDSHEKGAARTAPTRQPPTTSGGFEHEST